MLFPKQGDAQRHWDDPSLPALKEYATATARADGSFDVNDLPEGPYTVGVQGDHAWTVVEHVATDANNVLLRVDALAPPQPNGSHRDARRACSARRADFDVCLVLGEPGMGPAGRLHPTPASPTRCPVNEKTGPSSLGGPRL